MRDSLMISVPKTEVMVAWLQERSLSQRGEQIEAVFVKSSVKFVGFGGSEGSIADPGKITLHFVCMNLEQALAEFPGVGKQLRFPPGTRLVYIAPGWELSASRIVTTW